MKACSRGEGLGSDAAPSACSLAALWQAEGGRRWAGPRAGGQGAGAHPPLLTFPTRCQSYFLMSPPKCRLS